jgi:hypothetical protein
VAAARDGPPVAFLLAGGTVTQRCIEMVIGRLVTDEEFRESFLVDPHQALGDLLERGLHLTHAEIAALIATEPSLWERVAEQVDPRLQKISLKA